MTDQHKIPLSTSGWYFDVGSYEKPGDADTIFFSRFRKVELCSGKWSFKKGELQEK